MSVVLQNHIVFSGKWIKVSVLLALFNAVSISYFNRINLHNYFDLCLSLGIVMIGYAVSL